MIDETSGLPGHNIGAIALVSNGSNSGKGQMQRAQRHAEDAVHILKACHCGSGLFNGYDRSFGGSALNLRWKAFLILGGACTIFLVAGHYLAFDRLAKSFVEIETRLGLENLERAKRALNNEINELDKKLTDWSAWDDTYKFIAEPSQAYRQSNLNIQSLETLNLNLVIYTNVKGKRVFGAQLDGISKTLKPISTVISKHFDSQSIFHRFNTSDDVHKGILSLPEGMLLFSSRPIIRSDHLGPIRGSLIFGRFLTSTELAMISDLFKLSINLKPLRISTAGTQSTSLNENLLNVKVNPLNEDVWRGTSLFADAYGQPLLELEVSMPRDILKASSRLLSTLNWIIMAMGAFLVSLALYLLNRSIISRIEAMTTLVRDFETGSAKSFALDDKGNDEISQLARSLKRLTNSIHQNAAALKESQDRLQLAIDSASAGVWDWNMLTNEVRYDAKWLEMLGFSRDELPHEFSTFENLVHPDDLPRVKETLEDYLAGFLSQYVLRIRMKSKDGSYRWILTEGAALRNAEGQHIRMVGWHRDVTEEVLKEELVEKQRLQLVSTSRLSALGEMSAGVAHEINNPLAIIQGAASQLQVRAERGDLDVEKMRKSSRTIIETTDRIAKIIRSLRGIARDGARDPKANSALDKILNDSLSMCRERYKSTNVSLEVDPVSDDIQVHCRPSEVGQILVNLLNNAMDAVKDLNDGDRWVKVATEVVGNAIEVSVINGGPAIPSDVQQKLFQPFFTTKEVGQGTGLGLSISKSLAESNDGVLTYDSKSPNPRFVLYLPLSEPMKKSSQSLPG